MAVIQTTMRSKEPTYIHLNSDNVNELTTAIIPKMMNLDISRHRHQRLDEGHNHQQQQHKLLHDEVHKGCLHEHIDCDLDDAIGDSQRIQCQHQKV